jgi:S-adenosylmethionine/arginine decarboxylase-like enzyme
LAKWVSDLVKEIDMVAYGDPQIIHFGKNDPKLAGWTVLQFIETSNITAHFCDAEGDAYIDVFSCKYFDKDVVERHFKKWFSPKRIRSTLLTRCAS